jgi:hypothetical protein
MMLSDYERIDFRKVSCQTVTSRQGANLHRHVKPMGVCAKNQYNAA